MLLQAIAQREDAIQLQCSEQVEGTIGSWVFREGVSVHYSEAEAFGPALRWTPVPEISHRRLSGGIRKLAAFGQL